VGAASKTVLRIRCAQFGTYQGKPSAAGASLGWIWQLALDAKGFTTGLAKETGTLILNFGPPGLLYLSLDGKQRPVGKATAKSARGLTRGTWTVAKGTAGFTGRRGHGTYTFETARTNSKTVFSVARLELDGSIA
jgi:hypothetical protein